MRRWPTWFYVGATHEHLTTIENDIVNESVKISPNFATDARDMEPFVRLRIYHNTSQKLRAAIGHGNASDFQVPVIRDFCRSSRQIHCLANNLQFRALNIQASLRRDLELLHDDWVRILFPPPA